MTAEDLATQIRASGQIVERREIPERTIEQEAEKIKQFALQVATEAVEEEKKKAANAGVMAGWEYFRFKSHLRGILENIKKRLNDV